MRNSTVKLITPKMVNSFYYDNERKKDENTIVLVKRFCSIMMNLRIRIITVERITILCEEFTGMEEFVII